MGVSEKNVPGNRIENIWLVTPNRIDIVIGVEYTEYYENQYKTNFFVDLYIEHKRAFNGLCEGEHRGKEAHLLRFNNLIRTIKENKVNSVPVPVSLCNGEYWVIDGFHRSSILYYYNLDGNFSVGNVEQIKQCYYPTDLNFFKTRGLEIKYCNYTMQCFLMNYRKSFSCIVLFPSRLPLPKNIHNRLLRQTVYRLAVSTKNKGSCFSNNLIQLLYYDEAWCRKGCLGKSQSCFAEAGKDLNILFTEKIPENQLVDIKTEVRKYYQKGKHSVHTPDTQEECNSLLQLLNPNTVSFMNSAPSLYINFPNFTNLIQKLRSFCGENNINTRGICVTSSAVLSVYGIRDCGDLDLFIDKKYESKFKTTEFDCHNVYTTEGHYPKHFEDIIYNPDNHFYFQGFKFCVLSLINQYKKYRVKVDMYGKKSLEKDIRDVESMHTVL